MLSLIIPVYKNSESIPVLIKNIEKIFKNITDDKECIFVIDGSPDDSYLILKKLLPKKKFKSQLILLSKNFGSFQAIRAGLKHSRGNKFITMSADIQEPPSLILKMYKYLCNESVDIVLAARKSRKENFLSKTFSKIFWFFFSNLVFKEIPLGGIDMFGCNLVFKKNLLKLNETNSTIVGQIFWLGFRRKIINYDRLERKKGKSQWTISKKIKYFNDSFFSFTDLPIKILNRLSIFLIFLFLTLSVFVVTAKLTGLIQVPGYTMIILVICLIGSINLLCFGILGSYLWRAYENTKKRPLELVQNKYLFNNHSKKKDD